MVSDGAVRRWKQVSLEKASADRYVQCWSMFRSIREEAQCLTWLGSFRYGLACVPSAVPHETS